MAKYRVGIVGESNYQPAVRRCRVGDPVSLVREHGNSHDDQAIAVLSSAGQTIGYLGRDSWLREAILEEGKGCVASIDQIEQRGSTNSGVVLLAEACDVEVPARYFGEPLSSVLHLRRPDLTERVRSFRRLFDPLLKLVEGRR